MAENYREPEIIFEGWMAPEGTGIIVTGAASGIGAATCILAAQGGLKVAAWDMFAEGIQETIERAGEFGENIKAIYQDFHDQGFDVLGISLDSKKEAWLKGIQEEGYKWEQVSDLLGFKSPVCKAYDVNGIPALFLLDGDGKVIGKNLRGDDLRKKVAEYLNR